MISRDITKVLPDIIREALYVAKHKMGYSRTKLRKLGLINNPWKQSKRFRPR